MGIPQEGVGGGEGSGGLLGLEGLGPQMVKFMPNKLNFLSEDWGGESSLSFYPALLEGLALSHPLGETQEAG